MGPISIRGRGPWGDQFKGVGTVGDSLRGRGPWGDQFKGAGTVG